MDPAVEEENIRLKEEKKAQKAIEKAGHGKIQRRESMKAPKTNPLQRGSKQPIQRQNSSITPKLNDDLTTSKQIKKKKQGKKF